MKENSQLCHEGEIKEQRIVLRPRTGLNAGSRAGQASQEAKKEEIEDHPRTNLNGGELVQSTFLVLTFAFALAFMSTFVFALILGFLSAFRDKIFTFLGCNREKWSILVQGGIIPLEPMVGLCPCPWWPEKTDYLSQVPDQSWHILYEKGEMGGRGCCDRGWLFFFYLDAAWLNEGRCPGGRPSVSEN